MADYNNMSVNLDDGGDLDELIDGPGSVGVDNGGDNAVDMDVGDSVNNEAATENGEDDSKQLSSIIAFVWVLLVLSIIVFTASTIVKNKNKNIVKTEYVNIASNMYNIDTIATEEQIWTDYIKAEKKVESVGNSIAFYICGKAKEYNKIVYIAVTYEEYNSVNAGDTIEFKYSRLKIDSKEHIFIRSWSIL